VGRARGQRLGAGLFGAAGTTEIDGAAGAPYEAGMTRFPASLSLIAALAATAAAASEAAPEAILQGGNGIYRVFVGDVTPATRCGAWTATTGPLHPAGPGRDVVWGGGAPLSSYTTLRSHQTGIDYTTGGVSGCTTLCSVVAPAVEALENAGQTVGFRFTWTFADDPGPEVELVQEIVVEGPVDGSETVDSSVVRETHVVRNLGPGGFRFGLRKMWDLAIDADDGPWLGSCAAPDEACDRGLNRGRVGRLAYPASVVVTDDPAAAVCPDGVDPNTPRGCGGSPSYVVAATVAPPHALLPPPAPPDVLQFSAWSNLFGDCWFPAPADAATCDANGFPTDDTALAYFYGLTPLRAVRLVAGASASFTQYLGAGLSDCPSIITGERE